MKGIENAWGFLAECILQRRDLVVHFGITVAHLLHWSRWIGMTRENVLLYPRAKDLTTQHSGE